MRRGVGGVTRGPLGARLGDRLRGFFCHGESQPPRAGAYLGPRTQVRTQHHRQRFLAEQGYAYRIMDADELLAGG
ncbi:hypothetical protein CP970_24095 [Streptomyces kanamyceticus]|uniref:DNA helicase n=1 Tax=Streptomyces kanamyceticus TaxID=1967 RepID=A0A5J6GDD0_STRKN|nr:hypothetical protein CP970_24095 [Streptomyces kanamyceticus]